MEASEPDERQEREVVQVCLPWNGPQLMACRKLANEQPVREGESEERQGDPWHVDQRLLDRDERETPQEDEEHHRRMDRPAIPQPVRQQHIRGSWAGDKKLRAAFAGMSITSGLRLGRCSETAPYSR